MPLSRQITPPHWRYVGTKTPDEQLLMLAHSFVETFLDPVKNATSKHGSIIRTVRRKVTPSRVRAGAGAMWIKLFSEYTGDQCIVYPFSTAASPRGELTFNFKKMSAHRAMCLKVNKLPADPKLMALHDCGNGHLGCVTPSHLYWGTAGDNAKDAARHRKEGKPGCVRSNPIKRAA